MASRLSTLRGKKERRESRLEVKGSRGRKRKAQRGGGISERVGRKMPNAKCEGKGLG